MEVRCEKVEQITLLLENRPGILADLCGHLQQRQIDIRAISTHESADATRVRLLVDDIEQTKQTAVELELPFTTTECLALELPNSTGAIAAVARKLALAGINIDYLYATAPPGAGACLGVFGISNLDRALTLDWQR